MTSNRKTPSAVAGAKPRVEVQGKAIVERDGNELLVMFPDGEVRRAASARRAEKFIKAWFHAHAIDAINVGLIEWRDEIKPPTAKNGDPSDKQ